MNWKILFKTASILIAFSNLLYGQNYRISYAISYKTDSLSPEMMKKDMILLVKPDKSKFYSREQFENDSVIIESKKTGAKARLKFDYNFMVIKDDKSKKLLKFTLLFRDLYQVPEKKPDFDWKIMSETKSIAGYTCQKASLSYSGRNWEAWFTSDISLQEGPYIFNGLPGLIVYMKDTKNNYEFSFTGIKKDETSDIDFLSAKPLEISKKQLDKLLLNHYNDPYREMKSGNVKVLWQDENGKPFKPDYKELTKKEQKYIRSNNNPIELSEAINYLQ